MSSFPQRHARLWALVSVALLAGVLLPGCRVVTAAGRAAGSFFATPRPIANKHTTPIDPKARLAVLWIGHASALVQMDDKVILTDPVFTSTVGQFSRRLVEPGLDPVNVPPVDATVISHLHFDHLSLGSLAAIEGKVRMLLMPPTGVTYLTDFSFPVVELRPWQAWERDGLRVTAVPVAHVGFRYGVDEAWMTEGFSGYVIEYHGLKVYFGGDTAYNQKLFVETGERFPNIDLALLPIGPSEPRETMRGLHVDPAEALQAFFDLGAKWMVPVHYDTFVNSTDDVGFALQELGRAQKKWDLGKREVVIVAPGERHVFLKVGESSTRPSASDASRSSTPPPPASKPPPKPDLSDDDDRLD